MCALVLTLFSMIWVIQEDVASVVFGWWGGRVVKQHRTKVWHFALLSLSGLSDWNTKDLSKASMIL